jgi:hypothetical protein
LYLEFAFAIRGRNIEPEFPSETLRAGNSTDAAMLIPLTTDFHLATLPGAEDVVIVSSMVLYGVCESSKSVETVDFK